MALRRSNARFDPADMTKLVRVAYRVERGDVAVADVERQRLDLALVVGDQESRQAVDARRSRGRGARQQTLAREAGKEVDDRFPP